MTIEVLKSKKKVTKTKLSKVSTPRLCEQCKNKIDWKKRNNIRFCSRDCQLKFEKDKLAPPGGLKPSLYEPKYAFGGEAFNAYLKHITEENVDEIVTYVKIGTKDHPRLKNGIMIPSLIGYSWFLYTKGYSENILRAQLIKDWAAKYESMAEAVDLIDQLNEYFTFDKADKGYIKSSKTVEARLKKHGYLTDDEDKTSQHVHFHFLEKVYREADKIVAQLPSDKVKLLKQAGVYEN